MHSISFIYTYMYIYIVLYIYKISYICVYVCMQVCMLFFFFLISYIDTIQFQPYNLIQIIRLCILQIWDIKAFYELFLICAEDVKKKQQIKAFYELFLICAEDVKKKQQIKEAKLQVCNYYFIIIILCCARFSTTGQKNSELPL